MSFSFVVPGRPVQWQRARISRHGGFFTSAACTDQRERIATAAAIAMRRADARIAERGVPVGLTVVFRYPHPKRARVAVREDTLWRPERPDADNLAKLVLEALTGVAFEDDSQVVELAARKLTAPRDQEGTTVTVETLDTRPECMM